MNDTLTSFTMTIMVSLQELQQKIKVLFPDTDTCENKNHFNGIAHQIPHLWSEIFEKRLNSFFIYPELDFSLDQQQHKISSELMNKQCQLRAHIDKLRQLLTLPAHQSALILKMQSEASSFSGDAVSDGTNDNYEKWARLLEYHYMILFQSPEYSKFFNNTIQALTEYYQLRAPVTKMN